jgi:catechol 2,3-dioxygenase-like lactoylglutathione lyase family enzyme
VRLAPTAFHHVALRVRDVTRAAAFYSRVLGLCETRRKSSGKTLDSVWFKVGVSVLMLERRLRGRGAASGSGHLIGFRVEGLAAWRARLQRLGVEIDDRTASTLYFRDPDGHRVGLSVFPLGARSGRGSRETPPQRVGRARRGGRRSAER